VSRGDLSGNDVLKPAGQRKFERDAAVSADLAEKAGFSGILLSQNPQK
jgi:hypothetical protein